MYDDITALVPVSTSDFNGEVVTSVSARSLYSCLDGKQDFSTWIKSRIKQYGFEENMDYIKVPENMELGCYAQGRIEYEVTLEAAKVIAAAERTNAGRQILRSLMRNSVTNPDELFGLIADVDVDDPEDMFVYAIVEVETGRVKIGISKNPHQRLKQLQTANPNRLEIAAIREAPNRFADEKRLQRAANDYHILGEWFAADAVKALH